jgi:hypothetical protein
VGHDSDRACDGHQLTSFVFFETCISGQSGPSFINPPIGLTDQEWTFVDGSIELVISACDKLGVSSALTNTKLRWLLRLASLWG